MLNLFFKTCKLKSSLKSSLVSLLLNIFSIGKMKSVNLGICYS